MKLLIIKIGGNVIDDDAQLISFLNDFAGIKEKKILVHGGGKIATEMSQQLGIEAKMVDGRRITDAETLKVVQMVYAGLINKNIVAKLQARKCNAIGLTGTDGNSVLATKRQTSPLNPLSHGRGEQRQGGIRGAVDYGFVGDVKKVNEKNISSLLNYGFTPVIAPLTHDGKGQMLNTNADTMASAIAVALAKKFDTKLIYCFEKQGVLRDVEDDNSVIEKMNRKEYEGLKKEGVIFKGMIPKLDNAFDAIKKNVKSVYITQAKDLKKIVAGRKAGTMLVK